MSGRYSPDTIILELTSKVNVKVRLISKRYVTLHNRTIQRHYVDLAYYQILWEICSGHNNSGLLYASLSGQNIQIFERGIKYILWW